MSALTASRLLLLAALAGLALVARAQTMAPDQRAALNAAERWLVAVDAEQYAEAWARASDAFKAKVGRQEWRDGARNLRRDYGRVLSRKGAKMAYVGQNPAELDPAGAAREGAQIVIHFDTSFAKKKEATEEVTMVLEQDGVWRAAGYFIR